MTSLFFTQLVWYGLQPTTAKYVIVQVLDASIQNGRPEFRIEVITQNQSTSKMFLVVSQITGKTGFYQI